MRLDRLLTGSHGTLPGRLWRPFDERAGASGHVRGVAIVVHGLGDHSGRYESFARQMTARGWAVLAFDLPGHGLSPGRRGHAHRYDDLLRDIDAARTTAAEQIPGVPQVLIGHSMGGNLAINYVLRYADLYCPAGPLSRLVLAAPMLLPPDPPPRPQIFAAWLTGRLLPWIKFRRKVEESESEPPLEPASDGSADTSHDPLIHAEITMYMATQLLAQGRWAIDHARNVELPTLVIYGCDDEAIDRAASQNVAIRMGENATHCVLEGMQHDLLQTDHDTRAVVRILDWLDQG